ncbi:SbcD-like subunit of palindrome specific endonuclease [Pseudomonas phage vB_PpuM-Aura]
MTCCSPEVKYVAVKETSVVHIGDLHLNKLDRVFGDKALDYQFAEIRKPLDYAVEKGIKHVIFLGDISDKPRMTEEALIRLVLLLREYTDKGRVLHLIKGNHDVENKERHSLRGLEDLCKAGMLPNVHIYTDPALVWIDGCPINFAPFPSTSAQADALNIGHFDTPGTIRDNGHVAPGDLPPARDQWVIGHLHTPQEGNRRHYAGTLYQLSRAEQRIKSFTVSRLKYDTKAKVGSRLTVRHQRVPVTPEFQFVNVEVVRLRDLEQVTDNPLHLHTVWIKSKVELPATWLQQHPNVIDLIPYSNKKQLKELQSTGIEKVDLELDKMFDQYVTDKFTLTPQELKFAQYTVNRYHGQITKSTLSDISSEG